MSDRHFWRRVSGREVVVRVKDITAAADIAAEVDDDEPTLTVTGATQHTPDGCVDVDVTAEVLALVLPALIEEARELAMGVA